MAKADTYTTILMRLRYAESVTLGVLSAYKNDGREVLNLMTVEPTSLFNLPYISCIPLGTYKLVKRTSAKYGKHFHVQDVDGRTMILIHSGNLFTETEGCIIVGMNFGYVNADHVIDVNNSRKALNDLYYLLPETSELQVVDHDKAQHWGGAKS